MAEENDSNDDEEMMRMMEEEAGEVSDDSTKAKAPEGEAVAEEDEGGEAAFGDEMLAALQEEMTGDGEDGEEDGLESQMIQAMAQEVGTTPEAAAGAVQAMGGLPSDVSLENLRRVLDVKLSVSIELGTSVENIHTLLHWTEGSLIELDKVSGELVEVLVNEKYYARGEVVVITENFGVRITEINPAPVQHT